jgi:hypothetical protein
MFFYYFCLMIEGSGSISLTNGSGSGRPKNIWILRIRTLVNSGKNTSVRCSVVAHGHGCHLKGLSDPDPETVNADLNTLILLYFFCSYFIQHCFICRPLRFHCADGCWNRTQDRCN